MKDGSLKDKNKKNYSLRAWIRPAKKGASLKTQRDALRASGVSPEFIYDDWGALVDNTREGDIIRLYDLFYLGTSNRMIVDRWTWIREEKMTIDTLYHNYHVPQKDWDWLYEEYKRLIDRVGKNRISEAQEAGGGRKEAFDELKYRKAFDLWARHIDGELKIREAVRMSGVKSASTFYSWVRKYLQRFSNGEVPHDPINPRTLSYMRDIAGIEYDKKQKRYIRRKDYYKK